MQPARACRSTERPPDEPDAREGVPLNIIQRQLGHANLGTTSIYLQGIDPGEIITAVCTVQALRLRHLTGRRDADGPRASAGQAEVLDGET